NASYYRSKLISAYLKDSRIQMKFLPPYSPNLNLIERFWQFMNRQVRNNQYYEKFVEFKKATLSFF
ncbi:MAG: IS630 family transposase, partial [Chlamydiae bacterium]